MRNVELTQGKFAVIDNRDYPLIAKYRWRVQKVYGISSPRYYAVSGRAGTQNFMSMHRLILNPSDGKWTDHINRNGLDNRRQNLREATPSQNVAWGIISNGKKYRGVRKRKDTNSYSAQIMVNRKYIHLGFYPTDGEAAKAYDLAACKYFGDFARLNFANAT